MSGAGEDMKVVLVFPGEREVAAGDTPTTTAPRLEVDALVPDASPGAGKLVFETRAVNFKNNEVAVNGRRIAYLEGPGFGKASGDYFEEVEIPAGFLRPGMNSIAFTAGADVSLGDAGSRHDRFAVARLEVHYRPAGDAGGCRATGGAPLGPGLLLLLVLALVASRRGR